MAHEDLSSGMARFRSGDASCAATDFVWTGGQRSLQRTSPDGLGPAIAAEAARWGAYRREVAPFRTGPYEIHTRETHWRPEVDRLLKDYFPVRTAEVTRQWREAGLLDLK